MLAVGLCVALFAFWGAVGYAVANALSADRNRLQNLLLGPALGIALTVIPLFLLSRLGVAVQTIALGLFSGLTLLTLLLLLWQRPAVSWKQVAPFGGVLALALLLTGRPIFEYGLHWMSYCNDDMANYSFGARLLKEHGVGDLPPPEEITSGRDYAKIYWMLHVPAMSRIGCELIMAWASALTGVNEHQVFNPVILAFHLALIAAAGALVLRTPEHYHAALLTCGLLALSAMNSLGTLMQVVAQVGGLALLAACGAIVFRTYEGVTRRGPLLRHGVLVGLIGAGQAILYAELLPFLFLAFCAYTIIEVARGRRPWRLLGAVGIGAVVALVVLNRYAYTVVRYITVQSAGGALGDDPVKSLMPYFLVPGGLANLWGFQHITVLSYEPWLSLTILAGVALLIAAVAGAAWMAWRGSPVACFALVMVAVGFYLFHQRTGFGMFKLSMFIQPFLLGAVALAWCALVRRPVLRFVPPLLVLGASGLFVQQWYVQESRGERGTFSLIPFATPSHLDAEIERLADAHRGERLVLDPYNVVVAKFQALHGQGSTMIFPSSDFFRTPMTYKEHLSTADAQSLARAKEITKAVDRVFPDANFELHDPRRPGAVNRFNLNRTGGYDGTGEDALLVVSTGLQGVYNRRHLPAPPTFRGASKWPNFQVLPYTEARNHLIAIASNLSQPFYSPDPSRIGVYQLEPEPMYYKGMMAGLGRYLMFQVVNPTPELRLTINLTSTYLADGNNRLPDAQAIGAERWSMGAAGRGSARLFSPPLVPQHIEGRDFLMLDMGRTGQRFRRDPSYLMGLYGRDVALDRRVLVGFARDVSLMSAEQFARLAPPAKLDSFPDDLAQPDLEYSGIYEDGYCSEHAFAYLGSGGGPTTPAGSGGAAGAGEGAGGGDGPAITGAGPGKAVAVRGVVDGLGDAKSFRTEGRLLVDGQEIARQLLSPGPFELRGAIEDAPDATRRRVELRFSEVQRLPHGDSRPVAARLLFVGVVDATPADRGLAHQ